MISFGKQGKRPAAQRAAKALASVLARYADPVRLKVRAGLRAGGICVGCGNHNRRVLAAS